MLPCGSAVRSTEQSHEYPDEVVGGGSLPMPADGAGESAGWEIAAARDVVGLQL